MESFPQNEARHLLLAKKQRRLVLGLLLIPALIVFLLTMALLSNKGVAMTRTVKVLDCHYVAPVGEGYAGYAIHVHNADCYDEDGSLVCQLPEIPAHVHDASCYKTRSVLTCGQEEGGHRHDD
ncbi:MAG: hypothetical protein IJ594_09305, partial [Oscillospiraceae bacterium]|nr:hypothetical protein [Oscillospiraceae bacterium]